MPYIQVNHLMSSEIVSMEGERGKRSSTCTMQKHNFLYMDKNCWHKIDYSKFSITLQLVAESLPRMSFFGRTSKSSVVKEVPFTRRDMPFKAYLLSGGPRVKHRSRSGTIHFQSWKEHHLQRSNFHCYEKVLFRKHKLNNDCWYLSLW